MKVRNIDNYLSTDMELGCLAMEIIFKETLRKEKLRGKDFFIRKTEK